MLISKNMVDGRFHKKKNIPGPPKKSWRVFFGAFEPLQKNCVSAKNVGKIPTPKSRVFSVFKTVERLWLKKLQQSHEAQWIGKVDFWMTLLKGPPKTNPWKKCPGPCIIFLIFKKLVILVRKIWEHKQKEYVLWVGWKDLYIKPSNLLIWGFSWLQQKQQFTVLFNFSPWKKVDEHANLPYECPVGGPCWWEWLAEFLKVLGGRWSH